MSQICSTRTKRIQNTLQRCCETNRYYKIIIVQFVNHFAMITHYTYNSTLSSIYYK